LQQARAAGVAIVPDGENLMLTAPAPPPASVVTALGRHKSEVLARLRPGTCGWSAEDWHGFFEKRAGIAAVEARLPHEEAEARAFACCVTEWLNRKLAQSPPGRCLGCGGSEHGLMSSSPMQRPHWLPFVRKPASSLFRSSIR